MTDPSIPTKIVVRAIAKGGKFLGDDIGGALITIHDAQTGEFLRSGRTQGLSGPPVTPDPVMCLSRYRVQPILTDGAQKEITSKYETSLDLSEPRLLKFTALGPLAAPGSANEVSVTQWVYPGKNLDKGDGLVLEIPGLVVQISNPVTHYTNPPKTSLNIVANVTMMCGCPITNTPHCPNNPQPWPADDFEVRALITEYSSDGKPAGTTTVDLIFGKDTPPPPSLFSNSWTPPRAATYEILVYAYQKTNGNTGVARATVIIP